MSAPLIVKLENVSVAFGAHLALEDIAFEVKSGECVALIGRNGAGKSTLLKSLTGMASAQKGSIRVLDRQLDGRLAHEALRLLRASVGQVFQGLCLVRKLTALENVLIGRLAQFKGVASWARVFPRSHVEAALAALREVGVAELAQVRVDRLSGGEQQKIAIARALAQEPRLLLADEPTASLDPAAARETCELLKTIAASRGLTLITAVHDLSLLELLGCRVVALKDGKIAYDGPPKGLDDGLIKSFYRKK